MRENEIYVLGDRDIVTAFRFAGITGETPESREEAALAFARLTDQGRSFEEGTSGPIKLLILTDDVSVTLGETLDRFQAEGRFPLIVEVPRLSGPVEGKKTLLDSIREAIGVRV